MKVPSKFRRMVQLQNDLAGARASNETLLELAERQAAEIARLRAQIADEEGGACREEMEKDGGQ